MTMHDYAVEGGGRSTPEYTCDSGCGAITMDINDEGWATGTFPAETVEGIYCEEVSTHRCHDCVRGHRELTPEEFAQGLEAIESAVREMAGHSYFNESGRHTLGFWALKQLLKERTQ